MADPKHTFSNPALVDALELLHKENTLEHQNKALDEIVMRAQFLAPVVLPDQPQDGQTDALQFQLIPAQDGRPFFPAFTDWNELRKLCGPREQKTVVLTFDNYAAMLASSPKTAGFVINPLGRPLTLDRDFVAHLAKRKQESAGYSHQTIRKDTKVLFSEPEQYPQAMVDAIRLAVTPLAQVTRLYLRLMTRPELGRSSYLIVVDHTGAQDAVFRAIADAARPHLGEYFVDMAPFQSELGQAAIRDSQPFFARKA